MGDGPSESWKGKGPRRGILITPTCPFCKEPLSQWSVVLDECWKCGKSGMDEENLRQMRERSGELGRRINEMVARRTLKIILGSEGTQDDVERG